MALVDFDGDWGWRSLGASHVAALHGALVEYERKPLRTLIAGERVSEVPVGDICEAARERLKEIGRDDIEQLWELRLGIKKWRAWGMIEKSIYYFLWWDPEHTVCRGRPKGKRVR